MGDDGARHRPGKSQRRQKSPPPRPVARRSPGSPLKALLIISGVIAAFMVGCTVLIVLGGSNHSGKPSSSRSVPPASPSLVIPSASLTLSGKDLKDAQFMALLIKWAKRDNYPLGDRDQLIAAGARVCVDGQGRVVDHRISKSDGHVRFLR